MDLIGRYKELDQIEVVLKSGKSEFYVLHGRRRVGKTFLIRQVFNNTFTFEHTGLTNADMSAQLTNFFRSLVRFGSEANSIPANWVEAFSMLRDHLENSTDNTKTVFIDEMPWLDTAKSDFITGLEHFWNGWAAHQKNIKLIVCGSTASWIINHLVNAHGGLHNRVTGKMKIKPFTLAETEEFLDQKDIKWMRYQIAQVYMAMGGVPYYLDMIHKGESADQAIDRLFFAEDAPLKTEFPNLYASLFRNEKKHIAIVEALSKKAIGLTRDELIKTSKLSNGGTTTDVINELEQCGFIRSYTPIGKKKRDTIYQLLDQYTLFYYKFIHNNKKTAAGFWAMNQDSPSFRAWSGYSFEMLCLQHAPQIKKALGISGIQTEVASWRSSHSNPAVQIDLLIDRRDQVINLCEMKFSIAEFTITKSYEAALRNKLSIFKQETGTKKAVWLTMISTHGLRENAYAQTPQHSLTLDDLF